MDSITPYGRFDRSTKVLVCMSRYNKGERISTEMSVSSLRFAEHQYPTFQANHSGRAYHYALLYQHGPQPFPLVNVYYKRSTDRIIVDSSNVYAQRLTEVSLEDLGLNLIGGVRPELVGGIGKITSQGYFEDLFPNYKEWESQLHGSMAEMFVYWWRLQEQFGSDELWAQRERLKFLWPTLFNADQPRFIPKFISHPTPAIRDAIKLNPHAITDAYIYKSHREEGMLAYQEFDDSKRTADRQVTIKTGRLLRRLYPDLSDDVIREAVAYSRVDGGAVLKYAETPEEFDRVYAMGPSSCMSHSVSFYDVSEETDLRPISVLANDNINVAYLELPDGKIAARSLVVLDKKEYVCIYGNDDCLPDAGGYLRSELERLGYDQCDTALVGENIERIQTSEGLVCPYLDSGGLSFDDNGSYLTIRYEGDGEHTPDYSIGGVRNGSTCPRCNDSNVPNDEGHAHHDYDDPICDGCEESDDTVWAHTNNDYGTVLVDREDVVYCESDDQYYHEEYTRRHGIAQCYESGDWFSIDDMVAVDGHWVESNLTTYLPYLKNHVLDTDLVTVNGIDYHCDDTDTDTDGNLILIGRAADQQAA